MNMEAPVVMNLVWFQFGGIVVVLLSLLVWHAHEWLAALREVKECES